MGLAGEMAGLQTKSFELISDLQLDPERLCGFFA